jgi:5-methylcytosine-specific restriction endonuclease McrA
MNCMYCGFTSMGSEMYVVKATSKPRGTPNRWDRIGYCCEPCHEVAGKPIEYENVPGPRSGNETTQSEGG